MITSIRLYKYSYTRAQDGSTKYTAEEITNQMLVPMNDTAALDQALDMSSVILANHDKKPLRQFTRIRIDITDSNDYTEKIYRVVDRDGVDIIEEGDPPTYRHNLTLLEITKLLERVDVDSMLFTDYLKPTSLHRAVIPIIELTTTLSHYDPIFQYADGTSDEKKVRSAVIVGDVLSKIDAVVKVPLNDLFVDEIELEMAYLCVSPVKNPSEFEFIYDSTTGVEAPYTFKESGSYTVEAHYKLDQTYAELRWEIECVASEVYDKHHQYTIASVIDRLLSCASLRREGVDDMRYVLDEKIRERLAAITSPEFAFTQGTLREALAPIEGEINAEARLIPSTADDSVWNTITFDFLGNAEEENRYNNESFYRYDAMASSDNYSTEFVSHIQNGTLSNRDGAYTVTDPYIGGSKSVRTEAANFEITETSAIIKVNFPIHALKKVELIGTDGKSYDITQNVLEQADYAILPSKHGAGPYCKDQFIYWTYGSNKIEGLGVVREYAPMASYAIANIASFYASDKAPQCLVDYKFRVSYIPLVNFKARQFKPVIDGLEERNALYYNQSGSVVDISSYGKNIRGAIIRSGNTEYALSQVLDNLLDCPRIGMWQKDGQDIYYCYEVSREITTCLDSYIKVTSYWSKNYNKLNSYIGLKRAVRQYEISERESVERNLDYQDFAIVSATAPTDEDSHLTGDGFAHDSVISEYRSAFLGIKPPYEENTSLSYAYVTTIDKNSNERNGLIPVSCVPFGSSVVAYFAFNDNYSIEMEASGRYGTYALQDYTRYTDDYGRFKYLKVVLGNTLSLAGLKENTNIANSLPGIPEGVRVYHNKLHCPFEAHPFIVEKDSREKISVTLQQNFCSDSPDIWVTDEIAKLSPLVATRRIVVKHVFFVKRPSKFGGTVPKESYRDAILPQDELIGDTSFSEWYAPKRLQDIAITGDSVCIFPAPYLPGEMDGFIFPDNICGYGILTSDDKLVIYRDKEIKSGDDIDALWLKFRHPKQIF